MNVHAALPLTQPPKARTTKILFGLSHFDYKSIDPIGICRPIPSRGGPRNECHKPNHECATGTYACNTAASETAGQSIPMRRNQCSSVVALTYFRLCRF